MYVVSLLQAQVLPYNFSLFLCHQPVCGLVPPSETAASLFHPFCVISQYVALFLQVKLLPHYFTLFMCHQEVCGFTPSAQVLHHNFGLSMQSGSM
jgi:hypothetical protein